MASTSFIIQKKKAELGKEGVVARKRGNDVDATSREILNISRFKRKN